MRQRGSAWQLRVHVGRDSVSGRKRYVSETVHGTKREAQRALAALIATADSHPTSTDATVGTLLEQWYATRLADWSPRNAVQQRDILDRYLVPQFGVTPLRKLKTVDIDAFYARLRRRPGRAGKKLSAATVNRVHATLRAALNQGVKWSWLTVNPALNATRPAEHTPEIVPPDPADVARAVEIAAAEDPDFAAFIRLAAATGARRSQLCGLQWRDVDLEAGRLVYRRGVVEGTDGLVVKDTKTHRAYRLQIDDGTVTVLALHRDRCVSRATAAGAELAGAAFVFSTQLDGSEPWNPALTTMRWIRLRKKAGIGHVRLHDLRHFAATALLDAGVPVHVVAGRLGHSRATTTLNVYSHFLERGDSDAADTMGRILDKP